MEINIREKEKIVDIWLANDEKGAADLSGLYSRFRSGGYLVAVFGSGGEELADLTAGLLVYNQKRIAEQGAAEMNNKDVSGRRRK